MKSSRVRQIIAVGLAILWGLLYCAVASNLPIMQRLELDIQDRLIQLRQPGKPPSEILLVKIDQSDMAGYDLHNLTKLNIFYATLVKSLIANGAKTVVVNLPEQMKQYIDTDARNYPFQQVVSQSVNQIVLVTRPNNLSSGSAILNVYHNLLPPHDKSTNQPVRPEQIISYFRYTPNRLTLNSPARRADLFGRFIYEDDSAIKRRHRVKSVAVLALEKFYQASNDQNGLQTVARFQSHPAIQINFWGPADTFPSIRFQLQCSLQTDSNPCRGEFSSQPNSQLNAQQMLHDKLVLVDLPEGTASEPYREISPYGEMSVAEVEANLIASLMTRSFLIAVPGWFSFVISGLGLGLISLHLTRQVNKRHRRSLYLRHLWFMLGLVGSYLGFDLLLFWQGVILPLAVPISGWLGTGFGIVSYLIFRQSQQQKQKLAERQAVLFQTRKLLYRVATDIHDGPLQDLKLVMDSIELLSLEHPSLSIDPLLDRLETVGLGLRNQLSNTRTIAEKLGITPEIQSGLAPGIHQWLQQLIHSGDLVLNVKEHLQPLREPKSDSAWIDAREDIFRFFREAMTNVIRHAQPPNGTATQVLIDLSQEGTQCCLLIENDGAPSTDRIDRKHSQGGYGTKLMATIAAELPNGSWQRIALEAGGMRVTLRWTMDM